jgi:hypothetical protein
VERAWIAQVGSERGPAHGKGSEMSEDKKTKEKVSGKELFPVLPLRDIVVFP